MKDFHIMYTAKDGTFHSINKEFASFTAAESWLKSIGATWWEIGSMYATINGRAVARNGGKE